MAILVFVCSNCNRSLKQGERDYCSNNNSSECADCEFHANNGTRTTEKYHEWLRANDAQFDIHKARRVSHG